MRYGVGSVDRAARPYPSADGRRKRERGDVAGDASGAGRDGGRDGLCDLPLLRPGEQRHHVSGAEGGCPERAAQHYPGGEQPAPHPSGGGSGLFPGNGRTSPGAALHREHPHSDAGDALFGVDRPAGGDGGGAVAGSTFQCRARPSRAVLLQLEQPPPAGRAGQAAAGPSGERGYPAPLGDPSAGA